MNRGTSLIRNTHPLGITIVPKAQGCSRVLREVPLCGRRFRERDLDGRDLLPEAHIPLDAFDRLDTQGSGFRVQGSGFRVQGLGYRVQSSRFRVQD